MTSGAMMFIADFMKIRQLTQKRLWVKYGWQGVLCPPDSVGLATCDVSLVVEKAVNNT
jgi:hypothetical protein